MAKLSSPAPQPTPPAFPYPGGKTRLLKHILPLIPEHTTYVEPFAGGLAVLLAKPRSKHEVINDVNDDIVLFYRYLRHHPQALMGELATHFNSRRDFNDFLNQGTTLTELQRVVQWYVVKLNSYSGMSQMYSRGRYQYGSKFDRKRDIPRLQAVSERLNRVVIESQDWEPVVQFHDGPQTFLYLDPPYLVRNRNAYDPFTLPDIQRLRERLGRVQSSWLLSLNDCPAVREFFSGYAVREITLRYNINKQRRSHGELLILSPQLSQGCDGSDERG